MRFLIAPIAGLLVSLMNPAEHSASLLSTQFCRADSSAELLAASVTRTVTRNDFFASRFRQPWGLPPMDAVQVVIVSDEPTCQRAGAAYNQTLGRTKPNISVAVVRAGTYYVVSDPQAPSVSEWSIALVFTDSTFTETSGRAGY